MPASAPGSAVMMMKGSSHDWKFTTIRKIDQHDGGQQSHAQSDERALHGLHLPADDELRAARQMLAGTVSALCSISRATPPRSRSCVLT